MKSSPYCNDKRVEVRADEQITNNQLTLFGEVFKSVIMNWFQKQIGFLKQILKLKMMNFSRNSTN